MTKRERDLIFRLEDQLRPDYVESGLGQLKDSPGVYLYLLHKFGDPDPAVDMAGTPQEIIDKLVEMLQEKGQQSPFLYLKEGHSYLLRSADSEGIQHLKIERVTPKGNYLVQWDIVGSRMWMAPEEFIRQYEIVEELGAE